MLQLASATATLANDGVKYTPRVVGSMRESHGGDTKDTTQIKGVDLGFAQSHVDLIKEAMVGVTVEGLSLIHL